MAAPPTPVTPIATVNATFSYTPDGSLQIIIPPCALGPAGPAAGRSTAPPVGPAAAGASGPSSGSGSGGAAAAASTSCTCGHAHPSAYAEWDAVVRAANRWLSDNAPVCRGYSGIEPWARGDAVTSIPPPAVKRAMAPTASASASASKKSRSVFGCGACKKRKIKCDEKRPVCTNCSASSRKKPRQCVYDFDLVPITPPMSGPSTALDSPSTSTSHTHPPARPAPPVRPPPGLADPASLPAVSPSGPIGAALGHLSPQPVDVDRLSRAVEDYGLTWFIEASEVTETQFYYSDQRRAFSEYRQMVLERCWNAYIECHGKLLPDGLPGFSMLSTSMEILNPTQDVINNLMQAALLHAFVAVGAVHLAYWSRKRGVASTDQHLSGALALLQLSTNALLQVLELCPEVESDDDWVEEMHYRMAMTMGFQVMCRIIAADPLGPATLKMECDWVKRAAPNIPNNLSPVTMEVVQVVLLDALYALIRGETSWLEIEPEWLDTISVTSRLIPEGYGISVEMARYLLETVSCLYGHDGRYDADRERGRSDRGERTGRQRRLKALYDQLTNSVLVDIYASAHSPRVQIGDLLYRQALICIIAMDGFGLPATDPQLVRGCDAILELFAEAVYGDIYTVRWMLPLLVGGGLAPEDRRPEVQRIFDAMADTCGCHDIDAARAWTENAWERETWRGGGVPLLFT